MTTTITDILSDATREHLDAARQWTSDQLHVPRSALTNSVAVAYVIRHFEAGQLTGWDGFLEDFTGARYITAAQAAACLEIVRSYVGFGQLPATYPPGHEGPMWVVSLEGAEDWAIRISQLDGVAWPQGVRVEPVEGWCLGLYPTA